MIPRVNALRAQLASDLPRFNLVTFDKLEDYTYALHFTHACYVAATRPPDGLQSLAEEAGLVRDRMRQDALALVGHGLVDGVPIAQVKGGTTYRSMALDLQVLSRVLKESWASIQGKSAVTIEHLNAASKLSLALMRVVGLREKAPAVVAAALETRNRAFTLFIRAYEETRSAVAYLRRHEGDADAIAPSLYPGRPRRRRAAAEATNTAAAQASSSAQKPLSEGASSSPAGRAVASPTGGDIGRDGPFS